MHIYTQLSKCKLGLKNLSLRNHLAWWLSQPKVQLSRNFIVRLIIGRTTLIVSASAYGSYQVLRSLILDNLKENVLLELQQGANEIDKWLAARQAEISTIASAPPAQTMNWEVAGPYLRSEIERLDDYHHFIYVNPDGTYYNDQEGFIEGKSVSDRSWTSRGLAGEAHISDPLISRSLGIPKINVVSPIVPDTQPVRVLFVGISIARITEEVTRLQYGAGSYAFALNSKGEAISHPDLSLLFNVDKPKSTSFLENPDPDLAAIALRMINKEEDIELRPLDGQLQYVAFLPLQEADWSVALVIPRQNIEGQLFPLDRMAIIVVILAATMIGVLWQVQSFEQKQLQKTKVAAESANQAKSEFLANISHTFRVFASHNSQNPTLQSLSFHIQDTGIGIGLEQLKYSFHPFEQVGEKRKQAEGTGLGLAISQKIINLMGAEIQVMSQLGKGSTFFFTIEVPLSNHWIKDMHLANQRHIIGYAGAQQTLLIIDDCWENRSVLRHLLEPIGFYVVEAENGEVGLSKVKQLLPNLIITDIAMPVMDGYQFISKLRADETLSHIITIVSSASVAPEVKEISLATGGNDFLNKPVQAGELFNLLEDYLDIQWQYEEETKTPQALTPRHEGPVQMVPSPIQELELLMDLARRGRSHQIQQEVQRIATLDTRYCFFTQQVLHWAQQFQTAQIQTFLSQYLNPMENQR